ncbi:hypothetical protein GCK32_022384 [Trichostrongylus colubriformis]|uniref:Uncharacterized protein n=1 Tax=Trichostrongylus colubriformis TaxID=6319 RepID=A0AAN8IH60_TRICO
MQRILWGAEHLQADLWTNTKEAMNSKVKRLRKQSGMEESPTSRTSHDDESFYDFDFQEQFSVLTVLLKLV